MVVLAQDLAELTDEFALVDEVAAEAGRAGRCPRVRRGWVSVPAGGHISAVIWGADSPELVFLHDRRESARAWDRVAVALGRPAAAIDLPGHGRSGWRRDGRYEPARITPAVAEAIRAFAPQARLVVGTGLGGLTALAVSRRHPGLVPAIALVSTLPGVQPDPGPSLGPDPACDELAQLPVPMTLVLGGDGPLPGAQLARLRQRAPQIGLITVAGTGPDLTASHPRELATALDGLLSGPVSGPVSEPPSGPPAGRG